MTIDIDQAVHNACVAGTYEEALCFIATEECARVMLEIQESGIYSTRMHTMFDLVKNEWHKQHPSNVSLFTV